MIDVAPQLTLLPRSEAGPGGEFSLDDGTQPVLRLASPQRDLIAAAFTQLLVANCGGEDSFKVSTQYIRYGKHNLKCRRRLRKLQTKVK